MNALRATAFAIAVLLTVAQVAFAQAPVRYVEIIHAATAQVVFTEDGQQGLFGDAEIAYGEMRLVASEITFDSETQLVKLSGQVRLTAPEFTLDAASCEADLSSGVITANGGLQFLYTAQGVTATSDSGTLSLNMADYQPLRAELSGNVKAIWSEGLELSGKVLRYDFAEALCVLENGFKAVINSKLLTGQASELTGGDVTVAGSRAFLKTEGENPRKLLLTSSDVTLSAPRLSVSGSSLTANFAVEEETSSGVEQALFSVRGSDTMPVNGWLLDSDGNTISFHAKSMEKKMGSCELVLSGDVEVKGREFSLAAQTVVAVPEGKGVRVTIPERFRVDLAPELFEGRKADASEQLTG